MARFGMPTPEGFRSTTTTVVSSFKRPSMFFDVLVTYRSRWSAAFCGVSSVRRTRAAI
eukprot:CAMPEP_0174755630 /NCGR_PEP_ID=MMETSP1094-20130205/106342_1 /TAXON_ID=156173 /ORGANISM="Chrysochromulina brevifilum, Strain UTEX LB 985" /LENGTH=57 /DNA_ID=CAMNT_0015961519 /DNA_START=182 /DNA_END=355 /DNA_ORIENTATION=+